MDYSKSKAEQRASNNMNGGPPSMGDNGPRRLFGKMSGGGSNGDGLKNGKLYGKTGGAKATGGIGGKMSATGYPNPPRQSMASGTPTKPTTMKMGGGTVHAQVQTRSPGPKSIRGGQDDGS